MIKRMTDNQIAKMISGFDPEKEYARQSKERQAILNDPANAERLAEIRERLAIIEQLYKARQAAKLTQKELAEKMNVRQPVIARLERGRGNITIDTIRRYADACGKKIAIKLV